ncbi:uncharacterized protein LOC131148084 [Malania oleifera]|uniref:uncharacterized protein LOC131148084 n=1 Tax=Malania oleifera TaxID=397392 RepID=UPI0025ADFBB5|nr:uncharacterized protein LOC131148084 [Malania oleifera]
MTIFIQAYDLDLWEIISNGDFLFTKKNDKNVDIPKAIMELSKSEKRLGELNFKARHFINYALNDIEYSRICGCETTKEMWDLLQNTYEELKKEMGVTLDSSSATYQDILGETYSCFIANDQGEIGSDDDDDYTP